MASIPEINKVYDLIDDAVSIMTTSQCSFTAYDITSMVREQTDIEFYHKDVKSYIHNRLSVLVLGGSYTKEIDTENGAIRYCPVNNKDDNDNDSNDDANDSNIEDVLGTLENLIDNVIKKFTSVFKNIDIRNLPFNIRDFFKNKIKIEAELQVPQALQTGDSVACKQDIDIVSSPLASVTIKKRDKRNRLCIPKKLVDLAKFPQPYLYVYGVMNTLCIRELDIYNPLTVAGKITIDKSHNIRLSPKLLKRIGVGINDSVHIVVENQKIIIW